MTTTNQQENRECECSCHYKDWDSCICGCKNHFGTHKDDIQPEANGIMNAQYPPQQNTEGWKNIIKKVFWKKKELVTCNNENCHKVIEKRLAQQVKHVITFLEPYYLYYCNEHRKPYTMVDHGVDGQSNNGYPRFFNKNVEEEVTREGKHIKIIRL